MPEGILYEFDGFRLDPVRRSLRHGAEPSALTPKAFDLLLVFVQNQGVVLSRDELIKLVWSEASVSQNNFNVTLNAVRKALGESGREYRYIITVPNGYRFVADVRIVPISADPHSRSEVRSSNSRHLFHIVVSSVLYAALYGVAVFLEVAYQFDRYGRSAFKIWPLVLTGVMLTSVAGLLADQRMTFRDRRGGLIASLLIFFIAAGLVFGSLTLFLPNTPITRATFQTYPAQAAFLKDSVYCLALALLFLIFPFHFVAAMEREFELGRYQAVLDTLSSEKLAAPPKGTIYFKFWLMVLVLLLFAVMSIEMTAHLLDNLQPGAYWNLFIVLVYFRGILYFGLGIECLVWYYGALNNLKRECVSRLSTSRDH